MKSFLFGSLLCLSVTTAFASSGETAKFLFDGSRSDTNVTLSGEKTHTEYYTEEYQTTCSREVYDGTRTVCRTVRTGHRCRQGTNDCEPTYGEECSSEPSYRTEYYSCTETRTMSREVYDYPTEAVVSLKVGDVPAGLAAKEDISIQLYGESLSVSAKGSKNFIIEMVKKDQKTSIEGNVRRTVYDIELSLTPAAPVVAALNLKNMKVKSNAIDWDMGKVAPELKIVHKLRLAKRGLFGNEDTFYKENLPVAALKQTETASGSHFRLELKDIGQSLDKGKFGVELNAFYQESEFGVINKGDFKALDSNFKVIYSIR